MRVPRNLFQADMLRLGEECFWWLCRLLGELLRIRFQDAATARHVKLIFPSSAYISGISVPTLNCIADCDAEFIETLNLRFLQRIIAAERFYGFKYARLDTVLVTKEATENSKVILKNRQNCLYAKVLSFVKLHEKPVASACCRLHGRKGCIGCN